MSTKGPKSDSKICCLMSTKGPKQVSKNWLHNVTYENLSFNRFTWKICCVIGFKCNFQQYFSFYLYCGDQSDKKLNNTTLCDKVC